MALDHTIELKKNKDQHNREGEKRKKLLRDIQYEKNTIIRNLIAQKHITDSITKNVQNQRGCCMFDFYHGDISRKECVKAKIVHTKCMTTYMLI